MVKPIVVVGDGATVDTCGSVVVGVVIVVGVTVGDVVVDMKCSEASTTSNPRE